MNEMDLLTRLREEVPHGVSPHAEYLFRTALAENPGAERAWVACPRRWLTRRRLSLLAGARGLTLLAGVRGPRPRWRLAVVAPLVTGLAAGLAAALVVVSGPATHPAAAPTATVAARLLADQAATAAASGQPVRPGQWVYRKTGGAPDTRILENWSTADASAEAAYIEGTLLTCPQRGPCHPAEIGGQPIGLPWPGTDDVSYAALASLPRDPRALAARLADIADYPGSQRPAGAFELIGRLFGAYLMSPALTAELYRALGDIPGVTVIRDVADLTGQRGVAFRLPVPSGPGYEEIIVNPRSYQFMGWDSRSAGSVYGSAILVQALVPGPGIRP